MDNKKLKKIMTDLAAGRITKKEVELLIKPKKTRQSGDMKKKNSAHERNKQLNDEEVK